MHTYPHTYAHAPRYKTICMPSRCIIYIHTYIVNNAYIYTYLHARTHTHTHTYSTTSLPSC